MWSTLACSERFRNSPPSLYPDDATFAHRTSLKAGGTAQHTQNLTATSNWPERKHTQNETGETNGDDKGSNGAHVPNTLEASLEDLENDVLECIFAQVSGKDVGKLACVCKSFLCLTNSNTPLWRSACERDFNIRVPAASINFRDLYIAQVNWRTKEVAPLVIETGRSAVSCVAFTDELLLTGGSDSYVRVWDIRTGEKLRCLVGHGERVCCLQLHNGKIISGSSDSTIRIWKMDGDEIMPTTTLSTSKQGHNGPVYDLKCGGGFFASGSFDCLIKLWNLERAECIRTFVGHTRSVYCVDLDTAHDRVVSGSDDATVRVWQMTSGDCVSVFDMHGGWARVLRVCGEFVITGGNDGTVGICRVGELLPPLQEESLSPRKTIVAGEGHGKTVLTVEVQGGLVITGHVDGEIAVFDMFTGEKVRSWKPGNGSVFSTAAGETMMVAGFQRGEVHIRNFL